MHRIGAKPGCGCAFAMILWAVGFQVDTYAQQVAKLSPKVMAVINSAPAELKDDDSALLRLKKERFNAALNEAKARFDLYNRGLTRIPDLIAVGERLFGAEVDLYDSPEDKTRVLQRQLDVLVRPKQISKNRSGTAWRLRPISSLCDSTKRHSRSTF